jgi:maleate isomerase
MGSYNIQDDTQVAKLSRESVMSAALELGRNAAVDGVFVSCTSIRLVNVVEDLEQALGKPVTSSNHAMAWHTLRLAGIEEKLEGFGSLFRV